MVRRNLAGKRCHTSGSRLSDPARVIDPVLQAIELVPCLQVFITIMRKVPSQEQSH